MPRQVAIELLCAPVGTNRMRKNCLAAMANYFVSETRPKGMLDKMFRRLKSAKLKQLLKWRRRACQQRRHVQAQYQALVEAKAAVPEDQPAALAILDMRIALFDSVAKQLDLLFEVASEIIEFRDQVTKGEAVPDDSVNWRPGETRSSGMLQHPCWIRK